MEEIKKKDFGNAKRVADLYNEMKRKDAELLAKMSEKFPTLL